MKSSVTRVFYRLFPSSPLSFLSPLFVHSPKACMRYTTEIPWALYACVSFEGDGFGPGRHHLRSPFKESLTSSRGGTFSLLLRSR